MLQFRYLEILDNLNQKFSSLHCSYLRFLYVKSREDRVDTSIYKLLAAANCCSCDSGIRKMIYLQKQTSWESCNGSEYNLERD